MAFSRILDNLLTVLILAGVGYIIYMQRDKQQLNNLRAKIKNIFGGKK